jgi:hypothetical protein
MDHVHNIFLFRVHRREENSPIIEIDLNRYYHKPKHFFFFKSSL